MLKRRSLLLFSFPGIMAFVWPSVEIDNTLVSQTEFAANSPPDAGHWQMMHEEIVADVKSKLLSDIAAGRVSGDTLRHAECPICCLQFSVTVDGHTA